MSGQTVEIDAKAMLRLGVGMDLVMMFENFVALEGASASPTFEGLSAGRILIMPS